MRTTTLAFPLIAIAAIGLLLAPAVMADGDAGKANATEKKAAAAALRANHTHDGNDTDDNETADANESEDNETSDRSPKSHTRGPDAAHVPAHVLAFWTRMAELRSAWHENATKIREDCHAATFDRENATGNETRAYAHCIRDGYKDLREWMKAELQAAREDFRASQETSRAEKQAAAKAHHEG